MHTLHRVTPIGNLEFGQNAAHVMFHGAHAEPELHGISALVRR